MANEKLAIINGAYDKILKAQKLEQVQGKLMSWEKKSSLQRKLLNM